ncbi:HutD family protein [Curtobacterium sp. MCBD17_019]|uniref:HutD/Ves family protein n=1 Tax=Curtobacterium sp. MCBD17_019 TaxID=2175669 RepID=UPI0015E89DEB|nr:HutD family protein [Curtobacterium sp. MCBD17_019]
MTELVRFADVEPGPWANGGGVTWELARGPSASPRWDWRISIAAVEAPGPFSTLPGVDRTLVCLGPEPLALTVADAVQIVPPFGSVTFTGEEAVAATSTTATRDLNVMTRRGRAVAEVAVVDVDPGVEAEVLADAADLTVVVALDGRTAIAEPAALGPDGPPTPLAPGDAVLFDHLDARLRVRGSGLVCLVRIQTRRRRGSRSVRFPNGTNRSATVSLRE